MFSQFLKSSLLVVVWMLILATLYKTNATENETSPLPRDIRNYSKGYVPISYGLFCLGIFFLFEKTL